MKHRRGIDIVRDGADVGYTVGEGSRRGGSEPPEAPYRVEVWSDAPEAGGQLLETISRSTVFAVSVAALKAAVRERPGKVLVHLNQRHRMTIALAPDPPVPESRRPLLSWGRPPKKLLIDFLNGTSSSAPVLHAAGVALSNAGM
ncbi:hypothetical protein [Rhizobium terrae]|uniref:hypothetical protein n=1 Tax=Rhizobium terrae TaxID=2171756 RepID=UPI000E3B84CB|nr:hypothetical protein [Rhizobium terrae]